MLIAAIRLAAIRLRPDSRVRKAIRAWLHLWKWPSTKPAPRERAATPTIADRDPTAHAELLAIRQAAAALGSERLADCDLYVTLEPCAMCAAAMSFARIRRLYFGAADPKGGAVENGVRFFSQPTCHHRPDGYGGINESECAALLRDFFAARR